MAGHESQPNPGPEDPVDSLGENTEPVLDELEQLYQPSPNELQLTARAVITGCLIGGIVGAMNISIGLKIGWSFGGSLIAAILGYSIWHFAKSISHSVKPFSVLETNIAQTSGSAAGSMASAAGLLAPIPALAMLEEPVHLELWQLFFWTLSVGYLGVFYAVPLRRQMVVIDKLRFPTGVATAETIVSIFAEGAEAVRKARVLLLWAIIAAGFVLLKYKWAAGWIGPHFEEPPLDWTGAVGLFLTAWYFKLLISPVMFGAGLVIGPRVGISLLLGAVTGWLILGQVVMANGWVANPTSEAIMSYGSGVRGWILWPGVAIMVGDAFASLALQWRTFINALRPSTAIGDSDEFGDADQMIPNSWWLGGLAFGTILAMIVMQVVFGIGWYLTLIAVMLSSVLSVIAVRSTGETDINPVGGMGKVTQLVFGGITNLQGIKGPQAVSTNLMAAAITGSGASQAADMMQDLKTGHLLGASPRKQILAQCIGILAGVAVVVPVFALFDRVHDIGGADSDYPAPAAHAWKAMAELLSKGLDSLPTHAGTAVVIGLLFGAALPIARKLAPTLASYIPSGLAFGIAFIVPGMYSVAMFVGSMMLIVWQKFKPVQCKALVFAVASGLIAGEGLMNVVTALMDLARQTILSNHWPAV